MMKYKTYDEMANIDQEKLEKLLFMPNGNPRCIACGKAMKMAYDKIAKKKTKYNWECKCTPKIRLSIL